MRNMLAFLAAVVVTVAAVGWYLGWYTVGTVPTLTGHNKVTVDIDNVKIGKDIHVASEKIENKLAERRNRATPPASVPEVSPPTVDSPIPGEGPSITPP